MNAMQPREFALQVVGRLRDQGHIAYWAGGCVRDQLLGLSPKDYDVATDAVPERIRDIFGRRRTIPIGAAFGVVTVVGPPSAGHIEVATFRQDAGYSDGRHPDAVAFSSPEEDARRRDFTINGLFYDPVEGTVIDYVQGQRDLEDQVIRAIGDPEARFHEDKLRMLRAIRFASTFGFEIEPQTFQAVSHHAAEIAMVSGERIAAEMRRMLAPPSRPVAADLLKRSRLLDAILPEAVRIEADNLRQPMSSAQWTLTLRVLERLAPDDFPQGLAALLVVPGRVAPRPNASRVAAVGQRWRLSRQEIADTTWILDHQATVRDAQEKRWSQVQPVLTDARAPRLVQFARAVALSDGVDLEGIAYCEQKLKLPPEQLDPPPLLDGYDLKRAGISPGPDYSKILEQLRDAQLDGAIVTREAALDWLRRFV